MLTLFLLIGFAVVTVLLIKFVWKPALTLQHTALILLAMIAILAGGLAISRYSSLVDKEVHSGRVTNKLQDSTSCEHSYPCNCNKDGCSTCYEHIHDYDWVVQSTAGNFKIDRVDRQGTKEPPRFTAVKIGEPAALAHRYMNYIKGSTDSLFNTEADITVKSYFPTVPAYPVEVYDYFHVDRVLTAGVTIPDLPTWNNDLANMLADLGPAKQVNAIVVFTDVFDPRYATALRAHWLGGKKNDVVIVVGTPAYPKIDWVEVFSWSDSELFKVQLRDDLRDMHVVDRTKFIATVTKHINTGFVRKKMKDFEYLESNIHPSSMALTIMIALALITAIVMAIKMDGGYRPRSYTRKNFQKGFLKRYSIISF